MKVHVFSDSTLCVGVSNPDPSSIWVIRLEDVCFEHGFVENLDLAAREVQLIWHVLPGASTIDTKKHIQRYVNGQTPESLHERIIFISMFNDSERTKKSNTETCVHSAKEVQDPGASWGSR